jgi:hypothetical protein
LSYAALPLAAMLREHESKQLAAKLTEMQSLSLVQALLASIAFDTTSRAPDWSEGHASDPVAVSAVDGGPPSGDEAAQATTRRAQRANESEQEEETFFMGLERFTAA